ncbi:thermopsin family protease [Vulcanisaeta moutnovskia]|nr:thermopsin family protease [Vulcanisaeta moutnovskia]
MMQLIAAKRRLIIGDALGLILIIVFMTSLSIATLSAAETNYVIKIPSMSVFNVTNLSSNTSFSYTYINTTGGIAYLPPIEYYYYNFSATAGSYIDYSVWSTSPIMLYILTNQQLMKYTNGSSIEHLYSVTGSNVTGYYHVNKTGTYYVVIINNGTKPTLVVYAISLTRKPILNQWGFPIGIADYGIAIINGTYFAYEYETNEFIGKASIYNVFTQEPSSCPTGYVELGNNWFSIQLNTVLVVNTLSGYTQYYWLQNILLFDSLNYTTQVGDNVWNSTSINASLSSNLISGNGVVSPVNTTVSNVTAYAYYIELTQQANLPFTIYLITRTGLTSNDYPWIAFGYSYNGRSITWFDNVTIRVKSSSTYMEVSPISNGGGLMNDAELVIVGPWNSECTAARSLNITLSLYFTWPYPSDYYLSPVPSMWDFGTDTAEIIYDAHVSPLNYGSVYVIQGPEKLYFLNTYFIPLIINNPVNETRTLDVYTVNSTTTLNEPSIITVVPNETRYIFMNYVINNSYIVTTNALNLTLQGPTSIYVNYTLQYMLTINDPSGLLNGESGWHNYGSVVTLNEPEIYYLDNGTRLVFNAYYIYLTGTSLYHMVMNNVTNLLVNGPYTVIVNWTKQYQVNVNSPVPVIVSLSGLQNISGYSVVTWVNRSSTLIILVPKYYVLGNGTCLVYLGNNESIVVYLPFNISLGNFVRQYLVTIYSKYPVSVNGTYTTNITKWFYSGETLMIRPGTVFSDGVFLSELGLVITVNKPTNITVTWHINYFLTVIMYTVIITAISVIVILIIRRRRSEHKTF